MNRLATFATVLLVLFLAVGCSGGGGSMTGDGETGSTGSSSGKSTDPAPETTSETPGGVEIEQVSSGSGGLSQRQVVVAPSADALSEATGVRVPDAGEGTYLAAFWGEKPTGGYTVEFLGARMEGDRITMELALEEPPPDAMVSQALTQPYAAAVIRDGISEDTALTFVTRGGRELDWAVRRF
jgi:hypothetical protein